MTGRPLREQTHGMPHSLYATVAALALERLVGRAQPPLDALLCVEPRTPLHPTALAQAVVPGGWVALAAVDPANRFHAALAEATGGACDDAAFRQLATLAGVLEANGFCDVEIVSASAELPVVPSQEWVLRNAASPRLEAKAPAERAALLREVAARLKDLWREDAFRVPVAVRCVYARKRRIES